MTSTFPWPLETGLYRRVYAAATCLARQHRVTLYGLSKYRGDLRAPIEKMRPDFERIRVFPITRGEKIRRALFTPFTRLPRRVSGFQSPGLKKALLTELRGVRWDIVYAVDSHLAPYAFLIPARFTAIDFADAYSRYWKSILPISSPLLLPLIRLEYLRMLSFERETYRRADHCFIASPIDRDFIGAPGDRNKWTLLPNTIDLRRLSFRPAAKNHRLIFVGRMSYLPNRQAARRLVVHIMPGILREIPDAELFLVGSNPPKEIRSLDNGASIHVTGSVDDVLPYLRNSAILLCPLKLGTGTRFKVLEAMAAGIPVISTRLGCEGIAGTPGSNIILAETDEEFVSEAVSLLTTPGRGEEVARNARRLVEDNYSLTAFERCLEEGLKTAWSPPI